MLPGSRGLNIQVAHIPSSPSPLPPLPLPCPCRPAPRLVPSSYQFPSGQKNSVINPPLRLISKDQHWPRSHLALHHQNSVCRRCWEENLTETGFRMSGRLLSTCQAPIFQKEIFMWLTWWLKNVFIKQHTRARLVDPIVTLRMAEQKDLRWVPVSHCSHTETGAGQEEAATDLGAGDGKGTNTQCWGYTMRWRYTTRMETDIYEVLIEFCIWLCTEVIPEVMWEEGPLSLGWYDIGSR